MGFDNALKPKDNSMKWGWEEQFNILSISGEHIFWIQKLYVFRLIIKSFSTVRGRQRSMEKGNYNLVLRQKVIIAIMMLAIHYAE